MITKKVGEIFPVIKTVREYSGATFKGDLNAGITVGIMLIPQGMAYALLAGMPPVYGLYASLVPLLIYALFGTSRQLAVGPVAMVSLLVIAGVGEIAEVGSERFIQLAILTALGVGILQFLMGLFRMGFLVNFLSHPVLSGFTSAAALIIGASQIKNLLGVNLPRTNYIYEILAGLIQQFSEINLITTAIGIGSILAIILIRKWKKTFPSALFVVILGTVVTYGFNLSEFGVRIVGQVPDGLPSFDSGFLSYNDFQLLIPTILVISLVSYMESIAVAKAIAKKHGYKVDANQELIGLGMANIGGSFFQSFPTTGGFSRTAVNDQSGANTTLAAVISAGIIALTVLFLTPLFYYLPSAVLAAIIMVAVAGLFDYKEMTHLWETDKKDLTMLLVTFIATLTLGIEEGIGIGVLISLALVIYSSSKPHSAELGRLGTSKTFRNIDRYKEADVTDDVIIFRFDAPIYFANVDHFKEKIDQKIEEHGEGLNLIILDASAINNIDSTGVHMLTELIHELKEREVSLYIASAIGPVRDKLMKSGVVELMGEHTYFFDVDNALKYHQKEGEKMDRTKYSPLQTNV
ncbi:MAG: solute carrier family 26 protein [Balneolaceae bacterium]|nr:solute carrier family 26 protein [Balneolaceae bacterium]